MFDIGEDFSLLSETLNFGFFDIDFGNDLDINNDYFDGIDLVISPIDTLVNKPKRSFSEKIKDDEFLFELFFCF